MTEPIVQIICHLAVFCEDRALMIQRGFFGDWRDGEFVFPGGKLAPSETLEACALREFTEETGVALPPDIPLYLLSFKEITYQNKIVQCYNFATAIDRRPVVALEDKFVGSGWFRHAEYFMQLTKAMESAHETIHNS